MAHFRLTKISHIEDVPQIPVDSHDDLDNLETFLNIKENFEYMVNVKIFSVLNVFSTFSIKLIRYRSFEGEYIKFIRWHNHYPDN